MFQTSCNVTVFVERLELFLFHLIDLCDGPGNEASTTPTLAQLSLHVAAAAAAAGGMSVALRIHDWSCHRRLD